MTTGMARLLLVEQRPLGYSTSVAPPMRLWSLAWALVVKPTDLRGGRKILRSGGVLSPPPRWGPCILSARLLLSWESYASGKLCPSQQAVDRLELQSPIVVSGHRTGRQKTETF